jgi:hypothetical protein
MTILRAPHALLSTLLLIAGCTGSGIGTKSENPSQYVGCYEYNKTPILNITLKTVQNIRQGESIKVNDFLQIKNSNFILTQNRMMFDKDVGLKFSQRSTGFKHEFKRGASVPTLLLYDEAGHEFELVRSGNACFPRAADRPEP